MRSTYWANLQLGIIWQRKSLGLQLLWKRPWKVLSRETQGQEAGAKWKVRKALQTCWPVYNSLRDSKGPWELERTRTTTGLSPPCALWTVVAQAISSSEKLDFLYSTTFVFTPARTHHHLKKLMRDYSCEEVQTDDFVHKSLTGCLGARCLTREDTALITIRQLNDMASFLDRLLIKPAAPSKDTSRLLLIASYVPWLVWVNGCPAQH